MSYLFNIENSVSQYNEGSEPATFDLHKAAAKDWKMLGVRYFPFVHFTVRSPTGTSTKSGARLQLLPKYDSWQAPTLLQNQQSANSEVLYKRV